MLKTHCRKADRYVSVACHWVIRKRPVLMSDLLLGLSARSRTVPFQSARGERRLCGRRAHCHARALHPQHGLRTGNSTYAVAGYIRDLRISIVRKRSGVCRGAHMVVERRHIR